MNRLFKSQWVIVPFALALIARPALAWHGAGHMAVAIIAYRDLGPVKSKQVADMLRQLPDYKLWMAEKPAGRSPGRNARGTPSSNSTGL